MEKQTNHIDVSKTIRKCQRNWDYTKTVSDEHIDHLAYIAKHSPSKQDEAYFDLAIIKDRAKIQKIYDWSIGFSQFDDDWNPLPSIKNPQTAANVLFIWFIKEPTTIRNFYQEGYNPDEKHGEPKRQDDPNRRDNTFCSIGLSLGVTAWAAADLGYVTGFSKNLGNHEDLKKLLGMELEPIFSLGIGYPDTSLPHNISHEGKEYHSFSQYEKLTNIYEF
jgi:hypothetical protein